MQNQRMTGGRCGACGAVAGTDEYDNYHDSQNCWAPKGARRVEARAVPVFYYKDIRRSRLFLRPAPAAYLVFDANQNRLGVVWRPRMNSTWRASGATWWSSVHDLEFATRHDAAVALRTWWEELPSV